MTATRNPDDPAYLDEADTRLEVARTIDVCAACRRCIDLCEVFPAMFRVVDMIDTGGAAQMTPDGQDSVLGLCHGCTLCTAGCPYGPGRHPDEIDVHGLISRWCEMRRANGLMGLRERLRRARRAAARGRDHRTGGV